MMRTLWAGAAVMMVLVGCGAKQEPPAQDASSSAMPEPLNEGQPGGSFDNPAFVCGPRESYALVAESTCADGSMPLEGDLAAGQGARLGSMGSHQEGESLFDSHVVDRYEVPCPAGPRQVFVCMYHCPEGRSPLD